jgi:aspartate aminotransferase|tara:strand:+ start:125 stop:1300 length:1176 start_codon:yes stop_codon:yes gene_type:complete
MSSDIEVNDAVKRLGTETAFEVLARAEALAAEGKSIINLGIGQPDFKTPEHVVEAAQKALRDGAHGYTPAAGIPALRQSVANDLQARHQVAVDPSSVLITPGAKPIMYFAISILGQPGAEIMYPNPGFPIYESMIRYTGAKPVPIELKEDAGFAFDADTVLSQVNENTRLIIINSPANPTGGVVPRDTFDKLVAGLEQYPKAVILSDEIYSRILYDGEEHVSMLQYESIRDRLIVIDGWSKTYAMTGWRLGYGIWPSTLFEYAEKLAVNSYSCPNAASQHAGIAALEGPQDQVGQMLDAFDQRRKAVVDGLNAISGITCVEPKGAFYAFPNVQETGFDTRDLQQRLLEEAGVALVAGTSFGALGEGYLRVSYANSLENVNEAVSRINDFLS